MFQESARRSIRCIYRMSTKCFSFHYSLTAAVCLPVRFPPITPGVPFTLRRSCRFPLFFQHKRVIDNEHLLSGYTSIINLVEQTVAKPPPATDLCRTACTLLYPPAQTVPPPLLTPYSPPLFFLLFRKSLIDCVMLAASSSFSNAID